MFNICQVSQMLRVMSLTEFDDRGLFQISFFGHGCHRSSCFSFGAGLLERQPWRRPYRGDARPVPMALV